jgi:hypothetical protein
MSVGDGIYRVFGLAQAGGWVKLSRHAVIL